MRTLKFRAWDKKKQKIWRPYENTTMTHGECIDTFNDDVLMQFTGLKDKNGKEIYEGDILKVYFTGKSPRVIEWKNGEHNIGFNIGSSQQQLFEVIGNIYENGDLLQS